MSGNVADARLFDTDPLTGATEYFYFDPETDGFRIETRQDIEPFIERNRALWNGSEKHTRYSEMTRVASIPNVILMELSKQGIVSPTGTILDDARFRRWLNDRENLLFRTRAGKV